MLFQGGLPLDKSQRTAETFEWIDCGCSNGSAAILKASGVVSSIAHEIISHHCPLTFFRSHFFWTKKRPFYLST